MINKLLLVRKADSRSTVLDEAEVKTFVKGTQLNISPMKWADEQGISHYGFIVQNMKLADWEKLQAWAMTQTGVIILEHDPKEDVNATLAGVGLKINKAA